MTAGEWAARLMCTSASERRESCVNLVSRLEAMLPSCILESLVKVKIADMLESEFEAKLQAISHQSFNLVKNDVAELKALRVEKEEFENRMMLMNSTYLREITSKRDLTRTDSCAVIEMLSKEGHVGGDVQFYEPLQHLSDEVRQCVMSILDEKLKAIFEWSPEMKEKTSKFELAKFEDGLLRERLASYTVLNGQLREELRELRQRAKQAEIGSQRSEWEQQKAESQSSMLKRQLEAAQKELESISRQYDEVCRDAQSLRERLARAAQIEVAGAREQGDGGEGPEAPAPGAKEEGKEEDDQQKKRPQPAAPKQMVACGVQTDATQTDATRTPTPAVSREGTKEKELTPLTPPAGKPSPRQRRRSHSEVLMLSEAADLGDPIEKRLYQAERQAELSTKLLHQRDELIQSLQSRVESLQNTVEGLQAAADGGAAGPSLGGPTRGAPPDDGAAWERTVSFASDRSASDRSAADRSTAPPASPTEGDAAAMGARGGGRAPARAAEAGRGSGVEGEGAAGGAEPPEEGPVGAAREARERADFVSSMADSLREELQAAREELAAAEERLRALTSSERDDSPGLVQLEAESRARKAACDELEASKAALGLAQSRIKVLEAALGAQDFVSDAFAEEDEEEPDEDQQPVPTELGNAASRATAAEEFKSRSILLDQKKVLRDKVKVQKAQLSAIFHENTTLHLALNEVQKEMYSLTSKLRKRIPDSQQGTVDVESVLKRMEKVAASGIGGYIRLHKQAHLKEVAAAAVCGAARGADSPRAPADAARAAREAAGAGASGSPAPPADGGGGEPQRDGRAPAAAPTVGSPRSRQWVKGAPLSQVLRVLHEIRQTLPKPQAPAQARSFATTVPVLDEAGDYECDACDDSECFGLYEMEFDEQELATILVSLDSQDLDEEHIIEVFAEVTLPQRRRTWAESRQLKTNRKVDRDFFDRSKGKGTKKVTRDDFKKRSRCSNCGEKGHWREDCRRPYRSKADRLKSESSRPAAVNKGPDKKPAQSSFYFNLDYDATHSGTSWAAILDESGQVGSLSAAAATAGQVDQQEHDLGQVDLEMLAAATLQDMDEYALVDTAAGQALIGTPDIDKLRAAFKKTGFEIHFVDTDRVPTANGVGPGRVTYQMLDSEFSACSVVESIWVDGIPSETLSFTGRWIGYTEFPIERSNQSRSARSLRSLRHQALKAQRDDFQPDEDLEVIPENTEEDPDSELEMNWDQTPDPWIDGMLSSINYEEESMTAVEKELFFEGAFLLSPAARTWRRRSIKMMLYLRVCAISRLSAIVAPRMSKVKSEEEEAKASCSHPMEARWSGGNGHGYYTKCRICDTRLSFVRKTKEEIEETKRKVLAKRESKTKVEKEESPAEIKVEPPPRYKAPSRYVEFCDGVPVKPPPPTAKKSLPVTKPRAISSTAGSAGAASSSSGNLSNIEKGFETMQWMMVEDRKERQQQMDLLISVMKGLGALRPVAAPQAEILDALPDPGSHGSWIVKSFKAAARDLARPALDGLPASSLDIELWTEAAGAPVGLDPRHPVFWEQAESEITGELQEASGAASSTWCFADRFADFEQDIQKALQDLGATICLELFSVPRVEPELRSERQLAMKPRELSFLTPRPWPVSDRSSRIHLVASGPSTSRLKDLHPLKPGTPGSRIEKRLPLGPPKSSDQFCRRRRRADQDAFSEPCRSSIGDRAEF
ncbi:unnamed protein product [Prorocentrum cordatum]|nr:unnamed protein product [Polarella glacialis]